jgi:hypothetical protein
VSLAGFIAHAVSQPLDMPRQKVAFPPSVSTHPFNSLSDVDKLATGMRVAPTGERGRKMDSLGRNVMLFLPV